MMNDEKSKKNLHPIVNEALEIATTGVEPIEFDEFAIEELKESLKRWFGHPDLFKAVVELLNLAKILDEQGSHKAALSIVTIVATAADELHKLNKKHIRLNPET